MAPRGVQPHCTTPPGACGNGDGRPCAEPPALALTPACPIGRYPRSAAVHLVVVVVGSSCSLHLRFVSLVLAMGLVAFSPKQMPSDAFRFPFAMAVSNVFVLWHVNAGVLLRPSSLAVVEALVFLLDSGAVCFFHAGCKLSSRIGQAGN